ncbi:MAG: AAA family ATPase [Myxococcales bacterium]|nr:AAA family ATPase [Myxococcales bacterium]
MATSLRTNCELIKPNTPAHHAVLRLQITGGFLSGQELEFVDGLNCFIGGRGTGKTTLLEFLRYGLGLMPDPKVNAQRHRAIENLVKANLGGGRLKVQLKTKNGMRYVAERGAADAVQVVNEAGAPVQVSLDRDQIFSADVFSQNEIEDIASNPAAQLGLLDRFVENDTSDISRELEALHRQLDQATSELRRLDTEIQDLAARAGDVPILAERLKGLELSSGTDAARINAAHAGKTARDIESKVVEQLAIAAETATSGIASAVTAFQTTLQVQLDPSMRSGTNSDLLTALEADVRAFELVLSAATKSVSSGGTLRARLELHRTSITDRHGMQEADYRKFLAEIEEEGGRAAERAGLQKNHAEAIAAAKLHEAKETLRMGVAGKRNEMLDRISEFRDRRFAARKGVADRLSHQFKSIRVSISQAADSKQYRDAITKALKGLPYRGVAERLTQAFLPGELAREAMAGNVGLVSERTSFDQEKTRRVLDTLRADGTAYDIESVDLDDVPCIELLDGDTYKESPNLSTGQRCTTILPILLVQSERPLLIDQPEDNLDNAFIYDTVVKALRAVKGARQVIFVTHNPNIPVLGEAERVFVLESDGQKARLRKCGSVDECKDDIETILEGGREAFLQRKHRYGH